MSTFGVPPERQQRVLTFGILAALVMRAIFVALGAALISAFSFMFLIFGLLLIFTALPVPPSRSTSRDRGQRARPAHAARAAGHRDLRRRPMLIHVEGRRVATPLFVVFVVFVAIGSTDILFALDSIPAAFGVIEEAFIVFAANAFVLLGLRALYFLVSGLLDRLVYLSMGLSVILAFIGGKLLLHFAHLQDDGIPEIETGTSLVVITIVLAITIIASPRKSRREPQARTHAGSLRDTSEREARATARER
jgi:tellurite resistance protein TerC